MSNVSQVAYCGLFCGDCVIRTGKIGSLAGDLLKIIKTGDFQKLCAGLPVVLPVPFKTLEKSDDCTEVLEAMCQLNCELACKQGGGSSQCLIKKCCIEKKLDGCWQCSAFEDCETLAWLKPVHIDAHLKNLRILRDRGIEAFLTGAKHW
jgi:hypothetical protein